MSIPRHRRYLAALAFLVLIHAAVLLAPFLAPYDYAEQHRDVPFAPPSHIHIRDLAGRIHLPFVYTWVEEPATENYRENTARRYPLQLFTGGRLFGVPRPGLIFLAGSDGFGRDVFSRLLFGARISLFTGLLAAFLSVGLGLALGTLAGYFGGWPDRILMRVGN